MLSVTSMYASYGLSRVLFGVSLDVNQAEIVALLGRNGMGKTTTVKGIMKLIKPDQGKVVFEGTEITDWPTHQVARAGIGLVPEGRQVFPNLTVRENLVATARPLKSANSWCLDAVYEMFPELHERATTMGAQLSGGEQQMLSIARALMTNPRLLILDEATEGLAPLVRRKIWACLERIREAGLSLLVIDKNITDLLRIADRHYVLEKGQVVWSGSSDALRHEHDVQQRHLGVA